MHIVLIIFFSPFLCRVQVVARFGNAPSQRDNFPANCVDSPCHISRRVRPSPTESSRSDVEVKCQETWFVQRQITNLSANVCPEWPISGPYPARSVCNHLPLSPSRPGCGRRRDMPHTLTLSLFFSSPVQGKSCGAWSNQDGSVHDRSPSAAVASAVPWSAVSNVGVSGNGQIAKKYQKHWV